MPTALDHTAKDDSAKNYKVGPSCVLTSPELTLHTDRLRLVAATPALAVAALENRKRFSVLMEATPDPDWPTPIIRSALTYFADTLADQPELSGWLLWYMVLKEAPGKERVIGSCGFAGPPDDTKSVRLGFALVESHQGKGYATEAVEAVVGWALDHGAKRVWSKVPADNEAAVRVLRGAGMAQHGEPADDGTVVFEKRKK